MSFGAEVVTTRLNRKRERVNAIQNASQMVVLQIHCAQSFDPIPMNPATH